LTTWDEVLNVGDVKMFNGVVIKLIKVKQFSAVFKMYSGDVNAPGYVELSVNQSKTWYGGNKGYADPGMVGYYKVTLESISLLNQTARIYVEFSKSGFSYETNSLEDTLANLKDSLSALWGKLEEKEAELEQSLFNTDIDTLQAQEIQYLKDKLSNLKSSLSNAFSKAESALKAGAYITLAPLMLALDETKTVMEGSLNKDNTGTSKNLEDLQKLINEVENIQIPDINIPNIQQPPRQPSSITQLPSDSTGWQPGFYHNTIMYIAIALFVIAIIIIVIKR